MSTICVNHEPPTYKEQLDRTVKRFPHYVKSYVQGLFPIVGWLPRYNLTWFTGDLIAGLTVGVIIVPQGMAYAKIAQLPPEYGLYSSFVGLCIYCFFATSKDISIGPTAVMSLLIGQAILSIGTHEYSAPQIASCLTLFSGLVTIAIGLLRLGLLVDFISNPAIAGFMTGSCITIIIGQLPKLFGIPGIKSSLSAYLILGYTLKGLPHTHLDLVFGAVGLIWLYSVKYSVQYLIQRYPKRERLLFFFGIARNAILVIVGTLIACLVNLHKTTSPISILNKVPSGFRSMHAPIVTPDILSAISPYIVPSTIILILEHVAIAKSFGRINDYKIDPNQEIVAIGVSNIIGCFFSAYPTTGSFSRTAIKSKSGVRTPIAGVFSACVVVLALYALTPAFYFIPDAVLAAVIIHAVADLATGPKVWKELWDVHPLELFIFVSAVIITFFTTVEYGIYTAIGVSLFVLLLRIARPRFNVLGRIKNSRSLYFPVDYPTLVEYIESSPDGVAIFRLNESLTYPNASYISDKMIDHVKENTRRGKPVSKTKGSRQWNDNTKAESITAPKPLLKAIVIDFAAVANIDSTGIQCITDVRQIVDRWANRYIYWHFVNVHSPEVRRILVRLGFGTQLSTISAVLIPNDRARIKTVVVATNKLTDITNVDETFKEKHRFTRTTDIPYLQIEPKTDKSLQQPIAVGHQYAFTEDNNPVIVKDMYRFFHYSMDEAVKAAQKSYEY
ncbi:unnamed protein product [Didymodactylos carnosus]|uniref:STAS domain-containing protein n=1 Tax=Didymodactylos carnosus TaxID=1234261 RepID=A0A815EM46_9BILA|nr:unnamed protein product [Didymodactylos carnosus]CAF1312226.1 unnamed protein product [Didymodactylos carnosus]CAF3893276.1 unnamed protein product [Didymodactylos carnosus]CAF4150731.1 unnamed protein product [Didymodactylos carnosus]